MPEVKEIASRVGMVYASYAASLLVIAQALTEVGKKIVLGIDTNVFNSSLLHQVLPNLMQEDAGKALGMALTLACLFTTTFVRMAATKLVSKNKATDDQLTGFSLPLLLATTTGLIFMPTQGSALTLLGGLLTILALYASTAVPGQLDAARLQNLVSSVFKQEKLKVNQNEALTSAEKKKEVDNLNEREKFVSSRAAKLYSFRNGLGLIGIGVTVVGALFLQDLAKLDGMAWTLDLLNTVSTLTGNAGESITLAFDRVVLFYAALVASVLVMRNLHLTRDAIGLFHKKKISKENIEPGAISAKTFGINAKNAGMRLNVQDKAINDLDAKIVEYGVSSEAKMTDLLNSMIVVNNRLVAIGEVAGAETVAPYFEKLRKVAQSYNTLFDKNNLSIMLNREFAKLRAALFEDAAMTTPREQVPYVEEGVYSLPPDFDLYEKADRLIGEMEQIAYEIKNNRTEKDTFDLFIQYYRQSTSALNLYGDVNLADSPRVRTQFDRIRSICVELKELDEKQHLLDSKLVDPKDIQRMRDLLERYNPQAYRRSALK